MGGKGPAPKPTAQKIAEGNLGRRPLNKAESHPTRVNRDLEPPNGMSLAAKEVWRDVYPHLVDCGLMTRIDLRTFCRYCDDYARWQECRDFLEKHGEYHWVINYLDKEGERTIKPYPQVKQLAAIAKDLLNAEREFGMTPASRTRIQVTLVQEANAASGKPSIAFQYDDEDFDRAKAA